MDKISAFILSIIITAVIFGNYLFFSDIPIIREKVVIELVLDGDTVKLGDGRKIRLANINTPEKGSPFSDLSKDYLAQFLGKYIELESLGEDRYKRTLGRIFYDNNYINLEIVELGFAHHYLVFDEEVDDFYDAEHEARKNNLGMWKKSEKYGCISAEINKYDEYVSITKSCSLDLTGWTIKDESTKTYKFEHDFESEITLYSEEGDDTQAKAYWNKGKIWNDAGDRIFIRDPEGLLAFYDSY